MRKILIIATAGLGLALGGCQTVQQQRAAQGAVIGGLAGAAIGGVAGGSGEAALAGGAIGAVAGGVIGAATAPRGPCYVRTPSGKLRRVSC